MDFVPPPDREKGVRASANMPISSPRRDRELTVMSWRSSPRLASFNQQAVPCGRLPALLGGLSDAAALLMGMLGSCALMLFLSFTLAMKAVTAG